MLLISSKMAFSATGSIALVGSSSTRRFGSDTSARAIRTFLLLAFAQGGKRLARELFGACIHQSANQLNPLAAKRLRPQEAPTAIDARSYVVDDPAGNGEIVVFALRDIADFEARPADDPSANGWV